MKQLFPLAALVALRCMAQVQMSGHDPVRIDIDGKPFTEFHLGAGSGKPFLAPLRSASGKVITRRYPMETVDGESRDHVHHTGLWFSYDDVNGVMFWANGPTFTKGNVGKIVVRDVKTKASTLTMVADWKDSQGKPVLVENRVMTFRGEPALRMIDFDITLTAPEQVVFGDTKEGAFAIRLADSMIEKKGGRMINAEGKSGMAEVWGKRSSWVDYTGEVEGEKLGVAIFDHPSNPRHPTYWHARDYGLFALNPFGRKAFDKDQPESHWTLDTGKSLRFRWRVVIHGADADTGRVAALYKEFAK